MYWKEKNNTRNYRYCGMHILMVILFFFKCKQTHFLSSEKNLAFGLGELKDA